MKHLWKQLFAVFLVLLAASALCLSLNRFDNKYTHSSAQPLDGLLVLSQGDLENTPVHFLTHGWAFYPDVLLTPEDLAEGISDKYMVYTMIGERTHFGLNESNDPHGCATYVLHLFLPDETASYALELPEIYSAYKLYINGELKLQTGNPELETYRPETQNRITVFDGSGKVTILLAVSDYSHFYSGMVYPPAFGTSQNIHLLSSIRLMLSVCVSLIALLGALFACYLGIRMKQQNAILFSLLCMVSMLFTCYPLLHTVFLLPVQPWYAIEIACGYALSLLVFILQNRLCRIEGLIRRCSEIVAAFFCIIALIYGLLSPHLTVPMMKAFSLAALLFKLGTATYLLAISLYALKRHNEKAGPLFYATLFYAALLIWDRLLPAYEPILTGWFSEWGSLAIILTIGFTLWRDIVAAYSFNLSFAEEHRQTKRQLAMQMEYANQIAERSKENRKLIHDFRHHLRTIQEMAKQVSSRPETEEYQKELLTYLEVFPQTSTFRGGLLPTPLCNHAAVDALLQYFDSAALRQGVEAELTLNIPEGLPLSDIEWCTILGNLLENALEGCERTDANPRIVRISTRWTQQTFFLLVENTYVGCFVQGSNRRFLSHKRNGAEYGLGLESVKETVEQHGGTMETYPLETVFKVGIILPAK